MKKQYITIGVVVLVLAGMLTAFLLLQKQPAAVEESSSQAEVTYVVNAQPAPDRVEVTNESGSYTLLNVPQDNAVPKWTIEGYEKLSLDSYGISAIGSNATKMTAIRVIAENATAQELAEYGLDKPRASFSYGGTTVLIGANSPGNEGTYVMRKGENAVYLTLVTTAATFLKEKTAFVNLEITKDDSQTLFKSLTLSGTNYPEPIVIVETPETTVEAGGMSFNSHQVTSPQQASASQKSLETLMSASNLTAAGVVFVGDDADTLEKYGLAEPAAVIAMQMPDSQASYTLRCSAPNADGSVNLIKSGSPVIYKVELSALPWYGLTLFEIMDRMIILPYIDEISSVAVTTPQKTYTFGLTGTGEDLAVTIDGAPLVAPEDSKGSTSNFRAFYQTLLAATYSEIPEEDMPEDAALLLQFTYSYLDGSTPDVVSFYAGPTRKAYARLNDGKVYFIQSTYIDRVLQDLALIAAGEAVKSFY